MAQWDEKPEYWLGYITSIQIAPKLSVWNDFHFVNEVFWINRHGLTWHFKEGHALTGGFAYLLTATSFTTQLIRDEYRPWAQYETTGKLGKNYGYRLRLRYDHRIRREVDGGELGDNFLAYNRWRLMATLRRDLKKYDNGHRLSINLHNEILLNQGDEAPSSVLDQYRIFLLLGLSIPNINIQAGLHDRMVPRGTNLEHNWGFTIWVIQRFNTARFAKA
jgi:hypothetical protein